VKWSSILVSLVIFLIVISPVYAGTGNKWTTDCRFHLATQDTYIYLSEPVYADYTYLYDDQLTFTNAYMRPGDVTGNFTIITDTDVTLNLLMVDDETRLRIDTPTTGSSTLTLGVFNEHPQEALVTDQEHDYSWNADRGEVSVTILHTQPVTLRLVWSGWSPPQDDTGGPSPPPPPPTPTPEPPVIPELPPPPVEEPPVRLMLIGGSVFVGIIVLTAVSQKRKRRRLSTTRRSWSQSRRKTKQPTFPKPKPVTPPKQKKTKPKKVKRRKEAKTPKWKKDESWE
jgi:hypothetical protein